MAPAKLKNAARARCEVVTGPKLLGRAHRKREAPCHRIGGRQGQCDDVAGAAQGGPAFVQFPRAARGANAFQGPLYEVSERATELARFVLVVAAPDERERVVAATVVGALGGRVLVTEEPVAI